MILYALISDRIKGEKIMDKIRVLIIDDEPDVCEFLFEVIQAMNCEVKTIVDSKLAVETSKTFLPHLVFLDIMMPDMNGIEVLQAIREIDKQVKIVMVSGMLDLGLAKKAIKLGAIDYIAKPIDIDKLRDIIKEVINSVFE